MEVKCVYLIKPWKGFPNPLYTCKISSASIRSDEDKEIKLDDSTHLTGMKHEDVKAVIFTKTVVEVFPRNLDKNFPHLIIINIENCGLKEIAQEDFKGLKNLEAIFLSNNQLTTLPTNLFEAMPKLKIINFFNNKLEFLSPQLLKPLLKNDLTWVDFRKTPIDAFYGHGVPKSVGTIGRTHEKN